jgi:hypothetical protein
MHIIPTFKRTLRELPPLDLDDDERSSGSFGLMMFVWGVLDFVRGPLFLAVPLAQCGQWVLFGCSVWTLVVTTAVTIHLAYSWVDVVAASSTESRRWLVTRNKPLALIILASSSRLDMLSIFRLRLCGYILSDLPMESRHFHFIQNSGMYHHLIEDLPHGLVGMVFALQLVATTTGVCASNSWLGGAIGLEEQELVTLSTVGSIASVFFGLLNKSMQLRISQAGARSSTLRESLLGSSSGRRSVSSALDVAIGGSE